ncbi:MAG: FG-GAP-like repeat-containing protein [Euzebya sp.]
MLVLGLGVAGVTPPAAAQTPAFAGPSPSDAALPFQSIIVPDAGVASRAVAVGDLDGDGDTDMVVGTDLPAPAGGPNSPPEPDVDGVTVFENTGGARFEQGAVIKTGVLPQQIRIIDMDLDGAADIVVGNNRGGGVAIAFGDSSGVFPVTARMVQSNSNVLGMAIGDLNGDTLPDIVTVGAESRVSVATAGRGYTARPNPPGGGFDVALADMDGDGDLDMVTTEASLTWAANDGTGVFSDPLSVPLPDGGRGFALAVGDLDGDGVPDAATVGIEGSLYLATGRFGAAFTDVVYVPGLSAGYDIELVDVDDDGDHDLAISVDPNGGPPSAGAVRGAVALLRNEGPDGFSGPEISLSSSPQGLAIGDVDGDGIEDVTAASNSRQWVHVLLSQGGALGGHTTIDLEQDPNGAFVGDIDSDGTPEVSIGIGVTGGVQFYRHTAPEEPTIVGGYNLAGLPAPEVVGLLDYDRDGVQDILQIQNPNPRWSVVKRDSEFEYREIARGSMFGRLAGQAVVDIDGTGRPDILFVADDITGTDSDPLVSEIGTWLDGDDETRPGTITEIGDLAHVTAVGDLDGDDRVDVVTGHLDGAVEVHRGDGAGGFTTSTRVLLAGRMTGIAVQDVNADGNLDVVTVTEAGQFTVLSGDGAGGLTRGATMQVAREVTDLSTGDLDGDGVDEVIVASTSVGDGPVIVLGSNGDGTFRRRGTIYASPLPDSVDAADVDGDRDLDIVVRDDESQRVSIVYNHSASPRPSLVYDGDVLTSERVRIPLRTTVDIGLLLSHIRFPLPRDLVVRPARPIPAPRPPFVVLSRDDVFTDSLVGAALTGQAPLLYTPTGALDPAVETEINRLLPRGGRVYLLGGVGALSAEVQSSLVAAGHEVVRLAGDSRVETSVAVATEAVRLAPADTPVRIGVSRADDWADAVTGGAWAAATGAALVATPSDGLHPAVASFLADLAPAQTILLGGEQALSSAVADQAGDVVGSVDRVFGASRAETAVAIATQLWPAGTGDRVVVFNGFQTDGWVVGLAAAGLAADVGGPLLVSGQDAVSAAVADYAGGCAAPTTDAVLIGDEDLLSDQVAMALAGCQAS